MCFRHFIYKWVSRILVALRYFFLPTVFNKQANKKVYYGKAIFLYGPKKHEDYISKIKELLEQKITKPYTTIDINKVIYSLLEEKENNPKTKLNFTRSSSINAQKIETIKFWSLCLKEIRINLIVDLVSNDTACLLKYKNTFLDKETIWIKIENRNTLEDNSQIKYDLNLDPYFLSIDKSANEITSFFYNQVHNAN